ncbi:hypothetical protein [Salirhabdus sp. Marseille-P4669]|uniref:hypothetical protein n=1 Tax=Salirhabdus sp. Marseille-P4669 TaxID=2042310 RepID=UPI000C7CF631|nr:hypothetical protein [Salirhabdus sp. Marseille-P4669]
MPIQNDHEIHELYHLSKELEHAVQEAKNSADPREIQQLQHQLRDVQHRIQHARGKAINGSGSSSQPLIEAQLRVEELQHTMERAITNLNAMDDEVQP